MKWIVCCAVLLSGCNSSIQDEGGIRRALATGKVLLPLGVIEIHSELAAPDGIQGLEVRGQGAGSILRAAADFHGRAIFTVKSGTHVRFADFTIEGARDSIERRLGLPPANQPFSRFYANNGILVEGSTDISIAGVFFRQVAGFPILVHASKSIRIARVKIEESGSRNAAGRNNTTGGILLEEGTSDFQVTDSEFLHIRGTGVWTHSLYTSPRNADGLIARNRFAWIGRDAIQVGHATRVRVEGNTGERVGYPESEVDVENQGVPVAIDTAGNTDHSVYSGNRFREINGKCIDLDGFHHGEVTGNVCVNQKQFGVVMNDNNPDMRPEAVTIADNTIDGAGYGGIFVIGSDNRVLRNKLLNLNTMRCENCVYAGEPDMLRSGIYLGRSATRPAAPRANVIEENEITGFRMKTHCIGIAPGASRTENRVEKNHCADVY